MDLTLLNKSLSFMFTLWSSYRFVPILKQDSSYQLIIFFKTSLKHQGPFALKIHHHTDQNLATLFSIISEVLDLN